jgi:hypothetical protein
MNRSRWCWAPCFVLAALLIGCGREEIKVYRVPKETAKALAPAGEASHAGHASQPHLDWKLPEGWTEQPSEGSMRLATFAIAGKQGQQANAAVIALAPGHDFEVINILREKAGLSVLVEDEMTKLAEEIQIGPSRGKLFDMTGNSSPTNTDPRRILVAVLPIGERSWFVSMIGDDAFVREQKPVFRQFLESFSLHEGESHSEPASARGPIDTNVKEAPRAATGSDKNVWNAPATWQEVPPTQMLLAKFLATGDAGAKAEITITAFPGDAGGVLANVNRWRVQQLGLSAASEADLPKLITSLDVTSGKAMLVDMTGNKSSDGKSTRLIGAIAPQAGRTWFYKMLGDEPVVAREKEAFIKFVQTVKNPDVP